jgi:hypothetical protein
LALANRIGVAALMLLLVAAAHVHSAVLFAIFRLKIALVWVRAVALFPAVHVVPWRFAIRACKSHWSGCATVDVCLCAAAIFCFAETV